MNNIHGDDLYRYNNIRYNFSSNIYGHADLNNLEHHLASCLSIINSYPEPAPESMEKLIADKEGITTDNIIVTSGATALIYMIAEMMRGKSYLVHNPTFSEYDNACRLHEMQQIVHTGKPDLEWICNPNNPDGKVWTKSELLEHIDISPNTLFVIDASYEDYTLATLPTTEDFLDRSNVIVLHSMTKRFCIPGLRLGYAIAQPREISQMKKLRQPWSVNSLAIEAGKYLLTNSIHPLPPINIYIAEKQRLATAINNIPGFKVMPSNTTFFLCTTEANASSLKETLATEHGVLIRDASNFPTLSQHHFRIATQSKEDNDVLIHVLSKLK